MAHQIITGKQYLDVFITTTFSSFPSERRFDKGLTVALLKQKLELVTGGSMNTMTITVQSKNEKIICKLDDNNALLGSYPIDDGMILHVEDKSARKGEFEDESKVEKFEIPIEEYNKRTDTVRAFKMKNKLGRFAEDAAELQKNKEEEQARKLEEDKLAAELIKIHDRCEVRVPNMPVRLGTVKFNGETKFKEGIWIGIQYDEPYGKNDGSVEGHRYFTCRDKYGSFVKPQQVTVGDFPEEEIDEM